MTPNPSPTRPFAAATPAPRGFSLVELLTVIAILGIVIAIIIPALSGARNSAKRADTTLLLKGVADASDAFERDNKRLAGYFTAAAMGDNANATTGFTGMDNLLLDLMGGTIKGSAAPSGNQIRVGPSSTNDVLVDLDTMGGTTQAASGAVKNNFFTPKPGSLRTDVAGRASASATLASFPVLVDSWGQPVLAWIKNDAPGSGSTFAEIASNGTSALFYWNSNAGWLNSTKLGKIGEDQTYNANRHGSMLHSALSTTSRTNTMAALLGNPGNPVPNANPARPNSPRGNVVLHSAGPNGIYVSAEERAGRAANPANGIQYVPNQDPVSGGALDDVVYSSGAGG